MMRIPTRRTPTDTSIPYVTLLRSEPVVDRNLNARRDGPAVLDRRAELPLAHYVHRRAIEDARAAAADDLDVAGIAECVDLRLHHHRAFLPAALGVGRIGRPGPLAHRYLDILRPTAVNLFRPIYIALGPSFSC